MEEAGTGCYEGAAGSEGAPMKYFVFQRLCICVPFVPHVSVHQHEQPPPRRVPTLMHGCKDAQVCLLKWDPPPQRTKGGQQWVDGLRLSVTNHFLTTCPSRRWGLGYCGELCGMRRASLCFEGLWVRFPPSGLVSMTVSVPDLVLTHVQMNVCVCPCLCCTFAFTRAHTYACACAYA